MTRTINGIHAENKGFSWDWEQRDKITSADGGICMLDTLLTDVENQYWYPKLRQNFGQQFLIIIRMYPECGWPNPSVGYHWTDVEPTVWANECVRRLTDERLRYNGITPFEDPFVVVTPYNEQDLAIEGHSGAAVVGRPHIDIGVWRYIWETNYKWNVAFRQFQPKCAIGSAAMAGGHDIIGYPPDYEYRLAEAQQYLNDCDVIMVHAYFSPTGTGTRPDNGGFWSALRCLRPAGYRENVQGDPLINGIPDPGGIVTQYPHKPFIVKEFGNFRHYDASSAGVELTMRGYNECYSAYSSSGRCLLVTPFIWNCGNEHKDNRIRGNVPLSYALWVMQRYPAREWPYKTSGGETVATYKIGNIDVVDLRASLPLHPTERYEMRSLGDVKRIVIHHSASASTTTAKAMAEYHISKGWPGISYHFVVTANGEIQYTNDHLHVGYGVAGQNQDTLHVCLPGDFTVGPPPEAQLAATRLLIDNYRLAMGQAFPVVGHCDLDPTSLCPGKNTWPTWRVRLTGEGACERCADLRRQLEAVTMQNAALRQKLEAAKRALA